MLAAPAPTLLDCGATWASARCDCGRVFVVALADRVKRCACGRGWRFVGPRVEATE